MAKYYIILVLAILIIMAMVWMLAAIARRHDPMLIRCPRCGLMIPESVTEGKPEPHLCQPRSNTNGDVDADLNRKRRN